jgi:hypothetical protein
MSIKAERFLPSTSISSWLNYTNQPLNTIITSGLVFFVDAGNPSSYSLPATPRPIRYIRVFANGSTSNPSTHFVEIQALTSGGINRALNLGSSGGLSQYTGGTPEFTVNNTSWQILTNGVTDSSDYIGFASGGGGIQIDLGQIFTDISQIKFWNYYLDGRTYNNVTVFVSTDAVNWTTIYGPQNTATTSIGITVSNDTSNIWTDVSGNGINGTLTNGPVYSSSNQGFFTFDGSNDGVLLPGSSALSLNTMTISSWNFSANYNQSGFMFEKTTNGSVNTQYSLFFAGDNTIYYRTIGLSTQDLLVSTSFVNNSQWNNIVATFDGNIKRIYINGVLRATSASLTGTVTANTTGASYIGIYGSFAGYPFNGRISSTLIYNRALTESEILYNFTSMRGRYGI